MKDNRDLALGWLAKADYAVTLRYDIEFWPEKSTAQDVVMLATKALEIIRAVLG